MFATADSSCGELSEALQGNAKHEARLSNIQLLQTAARTLVCLRKASEDSVCYLSAQFVEVAASFARAQDDKPAGVFGRGLSVLNHHASITTGVPSSTISNNSITSSLRIRTQP